MTLISISQGWWGWAVWHIWPEQCHVGWGRLVFVGTAALVCVLPTICRSQGLTRVLVGTCCAWGLKREGKGNKNNHKKGDLAIGTKGKRIRGRTGDSRTTSSKTHHSLTVFGCDSFYLMNRRKKNFFSIQMEAKPKKPSKLQETGRNSPLMLIPNPVIVLVLSYVRCHLIIYGKPLRVLFNSIWNILTHTDFFTARFTLTFRP